MQNKRIIPVLLIENRRLVKTLNFDQRVYVGDPLNAVKIFSEKNADEIIVIDISSDRANSGPDFGYLERIADECFIPLVYAGGVRKKTDAQEIFKLGIEKIGIQSIFYEDPKVVKDIIQQFGSQAVALSIDVMREEGKYTNYHRPQHNLRNVLDEAKKLNFGEIIINNVSDDGTLRGIDLNMIEEFSKSIKVQKTFIGGVNSINNIKQAFDLGADAVGVGSFFVFRGNMNSVLLSYPTDQDRKRIHDD